MTVTVQTEQGGPSFFGTFEVPETASRYDIAVTTVRGGECVSISILNWGRCAEYGRLPTHESSAYSIAEHLTDGNMVDADNLVAVFQQIDKEWAR